MRVLMINSFFSVGGPPRIMNGIYDTLKENGHECKIAAAREKEYAPKDSIKIGNKLTVYKNAILSRLFDSEGFCAKSETKKLVEQIEEYKPDIIHIHNLHGYYINIEILFDYLKSANIPVVWTLHDCWVFTGHCPHFDFVGCSQWKSGECRKCIQKAIYPKCIGFSNSHKNYKRKKKAFTGINNMISVSVSHWLKSTISKSFLKDYQCEVIYNGVNLECFKPTKSDFRKKYGLENKSLLLGVAQHWELRKGFDDFIELAKRLDSEYAVVLIGISDEQKKQLPDNVIAIDSTNSAEELAEIYTAADLFLNLSVEETFGLVTVEALACGTPVLVYNKTASPELIDESCGMVVKKENGIDALYDAVCQKLWKNLSPDDCVSRAEKFDKNKKYIEYVRLYEKIVKDKM